MNIWKRFLSLALVFALVLSMGPIIPFVQANAETATTTTPTEMVWNFDDGTHAGLTLQNGYTCKDGVITWQAGKSGTKTDTKGTEDTTDDVEYDVYGLYHGNAIVFDNSANWTDYYVSMDVTSDCPEVINTNNFTTLKNYAQIAFKLGESEPYTSLRVRPNVEANSATYNIYGTATTSGKKTFIVDGDGATLGQLEFNMTLLVRSGVAALYVDGHCVWSGAAANGKLAINTFGNSNGASMSSTVTYDNIRVYPADKSVYVPVYINNGNISMSTNTGWNQDMASDGTAVTGAKGDSWIDQGYHVTDGWFKADFTLPAKPSNLSTSSTAKWYGVCARALEKVGSYTQPVQIESAIWVNKNSSVMNFRTLLRYSSYEGTSNITYIVSDTNVSSYNLWGKTVSMSMRIVGNYIEVHYVCEEANFDKLVQVALPATANVGTNFRFGIKHSGDAGATARITNIEVGKYDQLATLTVDASAAELVKLPEYQDPKKVVSARDAYYVGEKVSLVALTDLSDYALKANGVEIDPASFTIPTAGEVKITAEKIIKHTITAPEGVTVTPEGELRAGTPVTVTVNPALLKPATLKVNGESVAVDENNQYTFTMPAGDVTITCEEKPLDANQELYNGTTIPTETYSNWENGWVEVKLDLPVVTAAQRNAAVETYNAIVAYNKANGTELYTGGHGSYAVTTNIGGYAVVATIYLPRNNATSSSLRLTIPANMCGNSKSTNVEVSNSKLAAMFESGSVVTIKVRKIGNLIQAQALNGETVLIDHAFTVADAATNFFNAKSVKVTFAQSGTIYTSFNSETGEHGDTLPIAATLSNVVVGRINKTVSVSVDPAAGGLVRLPVNFDFTTVNGQGKEGEALPRTAYQVGEKIALGVTAGYDYFANGELIKDTANFVVPNADTVTITCNKRVTYAISENVDGLEVDKTEAAAGETVTITFDEKVLDADTLTVNGSREGISGSNGTYTFEMPAGNVIIDCDVLKLPANQTLYTNAGNEALDADLWTSAVALTGGKLTGAIYSQYKTAMKDGWFKVTLKMPETMPGSGHTNVRIEAVEVNTGLQIELGLAGTNSYRGYIRVGTKNTNYAITTNQFMTFAPGTTPLVNFANKEVTFGIRKVGNYFEMSVSVDDKIVTHGFTMGDIFACYPGVNDDDKTTDVNEFVKYQPKPDEILSAIDTAEFRFGLDMGSYSGMTVKNIEIGRINETVTVSVDEAAKDIVSLEGYKDPSTAVNGTAERARTAYQIGETIALKELTDLSHYTIKANGDVIDPANFTIYAAGEIVITATLDADPYYVNEFTAEPEWKKLGDGGTNSFTVSNQMLAFNHADGTATGTQEALVDVSNIDASSYVASVIVTAHPQQSADGVDAEYPWAGLQLNGHSFRVIPSSDKDGSFKYAVNIGGGSTWESNDEGESGAQLKDFAYPGGTTVGENGVVTYEIAVKVTPSATAGQVVYTLYIDGYEVRPFTGTDTMSTFGVVCAKRTVTVDGTKIETPKVEVYFDNLRIDRLAATDGTIGGKQVALGSNLLMDFQIAADNATHVHVQIGNGTADRYSYFQSLEDVERVVTTDRAVTASGVNTWVSWYKVTVAVPVKYATSDVKLELYNGDTKITNVVVAANGFAQAEDGTFVYSIPAYAEDLRNTYGDKYDGIANALADYANVADVYFNGGELDADMITKLDRTNVTAETLAGYAPSVGDRVISGIEFYGSSLIADADTRIKHYFKVTNEAAWNDAVVTVDGYPATFVKSEDIVNGNAYIEITGIHAKELDKMMTLTVTYGDQSIEVQYGALSYAYTALKTGGVSENLKYLAVALYNYYQAAQALSGQN